MSRAQVWERLAQEETDRAPPLREPERPATQQQQPIPPDHQKEE
jgi:hypothetical protein